MESSNLILLFFGWCVSTILVNGSIFDGIRNYFLVKSPVLGKLFSCIMCSSFWIGVALFYPGILLGYALPIYPHVLPLWFNFLMFPILQSGTSILIESLVVFMVKGSSNKELS